MSPHIPSQDEAERIAAQGLLYLSGDSGRLERFLTLSGMNPETLRQHAHDKPVLRGILEYILSDDSLVLGLSEFSGIAPEAPAAALHALRGREEF